MYSCVVNDDDVVLGELGEKIGQYDSSRTSVFLGTEIVETSWQYAEWTPMFVPNHDDERNFYMSEYRLYEGKDHDDNGNGEEELVEDKGLGILNEIEGRHNNNTVDMTDSGKNGSLKLTNNSDDQVTVTNLVMDTTRVCGLEKMTNDDAHDAAADDDNNKWTTWKGNCGKVGWKSLPFLRGSAHLSLLSFIIILMM